MNRVPPDIKRGLLSDEEKAEIVRLAERKFTPGRIAQKLNRHPVTVGYAMHRLGLRTLAKRDFCYLRNGVLVKSFCDEEDAYLSALRVQGLTTLKIAEMCTAKFGHRRSAHTIGVRLVLLSNAAEDLAA